MGVMAGPMEKVQRVKKMISSITSFILPVTETDISKLSLDVCSATGATLGAVSKEDKRVKVLGTTEQLEAAKKALATLVNLCSKKVKRSASIRVGKNEQLIIPVSDDEASLVLGSGHRTIDKIRTDSGATISLRGERGPNTRELVILGSREQISIAMVDINPFMC